MTATCLELIGAEGPTVLEGPFTANAAYRRMLAAATGRQVLRSDAGSTGTSLGAALLALPDAALPSAAPEPPDPGRPPPRRLRRRLARPPLTLAATPRLWLSARRAGVAEW